MDYAAQGSGALHFFDHRGGLRETLSHSALQRRARGLAGGLEKLGICPQDRVAVVAETGAELAALLFACFYAGAIAVPLPTVRAIGSGDLYQARLARQLGDCQPAAVIGPSQSLEDLKLAGSEAGVDLIIGDDAIVAETPTTARAATGSDDIAYIQYSSGSTRAPRGVVLTHGQVAQNCTDILARLEVVPDDRGVFWLPWFHDMGLVGGLLAPICSQSQVAFLKPEDFIRRPLAWLELIASQAATISFGTGFSFDLCTRAARSRATDFDLATWRIAGVGAEPIRNDLLTAFADKFANAGFAPSSFVASYGLAEATLAVTMSQHGGGGDLLAARPPIPCGPPVGATAVEIRSETGLACHDEQVGRIFVRGGGVASGYFEARKVVPFSDDGWLDTGDMGFLSDGNLIVVGRTDELIIVGGRNVWPDDIEACAREVMGDAGLVCAAFGSAGRDGRQAATLLIEQVQRSDVANQQLAAIAGSVAAEFTIACDVRIVGRRVLPRTSSGKISREAAKAAFTQDSRNLAI